LRRRQKVRAIETAGRKALVLPGNLSDEGYCASWLNVRQKNLENKYLVNNAASKNILKTWTK
jgi:hypothetical protein